MNRMAKVSLILLAICLTLTIGGVVYADDPAVDEVTDSPEISEPHGEIAPLPPIPTADEYVPPQNLRERTRESMRQAEEAQGDDTANSIPCDGPWTELELTYGTLQIPAEHGGGTAEGYSGFYVGITSFCTPWIQPVAGSRMTYGGEVDYGKVRANASMLWPHNTFFWTRTVDASPCGLNCARALGPRQDYLHLGRTWLTQSNHYFSDGEGADFDYWLIDTRHVLDF